VAAFAGDFDDFPEDDSASQPLPPEDRLWRHPSELGRFGLSFSLDPAAVRKRWLASQPSRASAWTAGLVGAILATGIVALGTHLASAFTAPPPTASNTAHSPIALSADSSATPPAIGALGTVLASRIATIGRAIVGLNVDRNGTQLTCLGVGVRADGYLVAPAMDVTGATSIIVTLANGSSYVGHVVGSDATTHSASSGLALLHINGITDLNVAQFAPGRTAPSEGLAIAITNAGGSKIAVGTTNGAMNARLANGAVLVDALRTDIGAAIAPPGSLVIGPAGGIAGIVTGSASAKALVTPSWLVSLVAAQLIETGGITHGWLGIDGKSARTSVNGVRVMQVEAGSAAARAGVRDGDMIVAIAGHRVASMADLQSVLYFVRSGTGITIGVERSGHVVTLNAVLRAG
jgi:S1-C subfamily serine protease